MIARPNDMRHALQGRELLPSTVIVPSLTIHSLLSEQVVALSQKTLTFISYIVASPYIRNFDL